ncbi:penicillin-binding transpeptidase domain-containing protein, partial [Aeromonas veronii]|nr:penicillin-binding transpeptidase domain-containing protein [Aeromonas veronii]
MANGGKMMKPYVVDKIVDPDTNKTVVDHEPKVAGQPVSAETAKHVLDLLGKVVTDGTGRQYNLEGYQVAGKTGTAEIPSPQGGYLYGRGNYLYSFLGMAPLDNPKLVVYVAVQQPELKDTDIGSEPVALVFNHVMKNSLQYLNIQPTDPDPSPENNENVDQEIATDSYAGKSKEEAIAAIEKQNLRATVIGNGKKIVAQIPKQGEKVLPNEHIFLRTDQDATLPDMTGWSLRDVMMLADLTNIKASNKGNGYVVKQSL